MLHVERLGSGDPVLLLHSSGLSGRQWRKLAGEIAKRKMTAIVPDLTGHGASEAWPEPKPFAYPIDVEELLGIITGSVHVVGHSYGGLLALQIARRVPGLIRSLTLYDPVALGVLDDHERRVIEGFDLSWDDPERWMRSFVELWGGSWADMREDVRNEFRRVRWVLYQGVKSLNEDRTPLAAYAQLECSIQLVTGEHTPFFERQVVERLGTLPRTKTSIVAGAGHLEPSTHADAVNEIVLAHMNVEGYEAST